MTFKTFKTIGFSLLCVLLAAMPLAAQLDTNSSPPYLIQPNDVLSIFVYSHPELSLDTVVVQPDGRISTPLVQSIQAAGLSPEQLKPAIEKRLLDVLDVANVTVVLKSIQSYRVFVTGKVQKPGLLTYEKPLTVLQALALAGGFQDYAKKDAITIIRTVAPQGTRGQQEQRFPFNWDDVVAGKNQLQDIFLQNGDVVTVQ